MEETRSVSQSMDGAAESFSRHASAARVALGTSEFHNIRHEALPQGHALSLHNAYVRLRPPNTARSHSHTLRQRNNVYSSARAALAAFSFAEQV